MQIHDREGAIYLLEYLVKSLHHIFWDIRSILGVQAYECQYY